MVFLYGYRIRNPPAKQAAILQIPFEKLRAHTRGPYKMSDNMSAQNAPNHSLITSLHGPNFCLGPLKEPLKRTRGSNRKSLGSFGARSQKSRQTFHSLSLSPHSTSLARDPPRPPKCAQNNRPYKGYTAILSISGYGAIIFGTLKVLRFRGPNPQQLLLSEPEASTKRSRPQFSPML